MNASAPVTPSTLFYLFADRVAPKDKVTTEGLEVPCRGVKVQKKALVATAFAAAFVHLRDQGLIGLELQQKKVLFVKTRKVVVTRVGEATRPGLEGAVLEGLGPKATATVDEVIRRWFGGDEFSPFDHVLDAIAAEALDAGCFEHPETEGGGRVRKLLARSVTVPVCERIAALEPDFQTFHSRWSVFQSSEPDLHDELIEECEKAIDDREEDPDDTFD